MKGEGRRSRSLVMEDYLQLAAGTLQFIYEQTQKENSCFLKLTLQEETVRLLCDGFRCEG